ncbi:MAG: hypothetical protein KAS32_09305 [Candidatus Peribacteraceae bacterium]|nr:hypothetical protein [Candidatus Peribacteraceae bacterium]
MNPILLILVLSSVFLTGCCTPEQAVTVNQLTDVYIDVSMPEPQVMYDICCRADNTDGIYFNLQESYVRLYDYKNTMIETDSIRYFIRKPVFNIDNFEDLLFFDEDFNRFLNDAEANKDSEIRCDVDPFKPRSGITITKTTTIGTETKKMGGWHSIDFRCDLTDGMYNIEYDGFSRQSAECWFNSMIDDLVSDMLYQERD